MATGIVAAGCADAVTEGILRVLVGGVVGAAFDGRGMYRFGLRVEAEERGNVIATYGPQAWLFGAKVQAATGVEGDGLVLLYWKR